jgi:hypothetical protein
MLTELPCHTPKENYEEGDAVSDPVTYKHIVGKTPMVFNDFK